MPIRFSTTLRQSWAGIAPVVRRNFVLDFYSAIFYGAFISAINTFVPVVARRLGADALMLSLIAAAPAVGNIIAVLAAHLLQQRRKMPFMVAAWTIGRGLFLLAPFIVAPEPFVFIVVLHWLWVSIPVTGYVEVMREIYPAAIRGSLMAYVRVGFTATATILTPLVGQLLDVWSYQVLFPVAAIFGVLSGIAFGRVTYADVPAPAQHDLWQPWRVFRRDKCFRDYSIAFMFCGFGYLLISPLIPIMLVDELHLNYGEVGFLGMVNSIFWMLFYIVWGRAVDRRGGLWAVQINLFLTVFISLAFFFATNLWLVMLAYIVTGITVAGTDLGWMNAIMQFARKDDVSDYTALHAFLVGVRGIVAPLLGTVLMTIPWIGLRGVFLLSAFVILIGWWRMRYVAIPESLEA